MLYEKFKWVWMGYESDYVKTTCSRLKKKWVQRHIDDWPQFGERYDITQVLKKVLWDREKLMTMR